MSLMTAKKHSWKMTNLTLIGWHGFDMDDIKISTDGVTMITAENGVGKTSTLDAITTILNGPDIGSSSKIGFNSLAQTGQSNRSLVSYMLGAHNNKIRRDVSHTWLALSLRHSQKNSCISLIIYMYADAESYSQDSKKPRERHCIILEGQEVSVNDFIHQEGEYRRAMDYKEWRQKFKDKLIYETDKTSEYRDKIRANLGPLGSMLSEQFYTNLKTMMQKRDIRNIDGFIRDDLLQKPDINLKSMQSSINEMDIFQAEIKECETIIATLQNVINPGNNLITVYDKLHDLNQKIRISKLYELYSSKLNTQKKINQKIEQLENLKTEEINGKLITERLNQAQNDAYNAKNNNTNASIIKDLENNRKIISMQLENINKQCSNLIHQASAVSESLKSLFNVNYQITSKSDIVDILKWIENNEDALITIQERDGLLYSKEKELRIKEEKLEEVLIDKNNMEQNNKRPDPNAFKLMTELKQNGIEGEYLFETIDTIDDEWRQALESVILHNRSTIIVKPEDYKEATRTLRNSGITFAKIVHPKIMEDKYNISETSLYHKISTQNKIADSYLKSLIGNIHCADSLEELSSGQYRNAIMANAVNGVLTRIGNWSTYNIKAIEISQYLLLNINPNDYKKEMKKLNDTQISLNDRITQLQKEIHKIKTDIHTVNQINDFYDNVNKNTLKIFDEAENHISQYTEINQQIAEKENDKTHLNLTQAYEEAYKAFNEHNQFMAKLASDIGSISTQIETQNNQLTNISHGYSLLCQQYNYDDNKTLDKPDFLNEAEEKNIALFINKSQNQVEALNNQIQDNQQIYLKNFFVAKNNYAGHKDILGYDFFDNEQTDYDSIIDKNEKMTTCITRQKETYLINKQETLHQWKEELIVKLKEDYVAKAYASMHNNQELIKRLNKAISNLRYHNSKYIFTSKIKKDYKSIQDFVIEARDSGGIFNLEDFGNIDVLQVLLSKIKEDEEGILDPRNWFEYDIKIEPEDGTSTTVSQRLTTGSGGEIAAPFYVCMCAALSIVSYPNNSANGGLCIALFDESFEKLDTSVINEIFKMFEVSGIQVILCDPGKNVQLNALCKTLIQLHKDGEKMFIQEVSIGSKVKDNFMDNNPVTIGKSTWLDRERQKNQGQLFS